MDVKKQKILYVITKGNFGGAQRYVFDLATNLREQYDVAVAFGQPGLLGKKLTEAGIRTIQINSLHRDIRITDELKVLWELFRLFRKEKPDIVHLNSSKIGGIGGLAARLARVPGIVYTSHGWAFNEDRPAFAKFLISVAEWTTVFLSHLVIDVSENTATHIRKFPFTAKKVRVVHNGIQTFAPLGKDAARGELAALNQKLSEHMSDIWIGTISELHPNKGLDFLIEALGKVRKNNQKVIFVCLGEGEKRAELEEQANKMCPGAAFFLGFVPDANKYLGAFDIVTLTSRKEGFPYMLLEAGIAKKPIIASHVGGIPEIIDDMQSGMLINAYRPNDITHALLFLIDHPEKQTEFGQAIGKKVKEEFSLAKMEAETVRVYNEVLQ